jgi:hypothetical protein
MPKLLRDNRFNLFFMSGTAPSGLLFELHNWHFVRIHHLFLSDSLNCCGLHFQTPVLADCYPQNWDKFVGSVTSRSWWKHHRPKTRIPVEHSPKRCPLDEWRQLTGQCSPIYSALFLLSRPCSGAGDSGQMLHRWTLLESGLHSVSAHLNWRAFMHDGKVQGY